MQRHLVTNVQVHPRADAELDVHSCFQAHRYRLDREVEVFYLDHTTVLGNNLSLFL